MDTILDAVHWHGHVFFLTSNREFWRVFFDREFYPFMERLAGDEPEWVEPLNELKRRAKVYGVIA